MDVILCSSREVLLAALWVTTPHEGKRILHWGQRKEQSIECRHPPEGKGSPVSIGASRAPIGVESTSEGSDVMCP